MLPAVVVINFHDSLRHGRKETIFPAATIHLFQKSMVVAALSHARHASPPNIQNPIVEHAPSLFERIRKQHRRLTRRLIMPASRPLSQCKSNAKCNTLLVHTSIKGRYLGVE